MKDDFFEEYRELQRIADAKRELITYYIEYTFINQDEWFITLKHQDEIINRYSSEETTYNRHEAQIWFVFNFLAFYEGEEVWVNINTALMYSITLSLKRFLNRVQRPKFKTMTDELCLKIIDNTFNKDHVYWDFRCLCLRNFIPELRKSKLKKIEDWLSQ